MTSSAAAQTPTSGNCWSKVTIGPDLRANENVIGPIDQWSNTANSHPIPGGFSHGRKTFHAAEFIERVKDRMNASPPAGYVGAIGFQLSVRAKLAANAPKPAPMSQNLLVNTAFGTVAGYPSSLPQGSQPDIGNPYMSVSRRFDSASTAKTITAVAAAAAFEEIEELGNPMKVTLESRVKPHLNAIGWTVNNSLANMTFRDLLRHTTPLCENGRPGSDRYADLKAMMAFQPTMADAPWQPSPGNPIAGNYCNRNFALMRILIAILVDGPKIFFHPNGAPRTDTERDRISAISYRNFVRGKLFAPIGLNDVDVFYKGPLPETIYFGENGMAIPDRVNVGAPNDTSGYDQRANTTMLMAGAGFWFLSAQEWTLFLSNLWAGRIVSQESLRRLLTSMPLGMGRGTDVESGQWTWGHNGGGWAGGPSTQWVTFPDGASAVIQSNAPTGDASFRTILQQEYAAAWY
jgi:CubicO group peptidase (beta-lactamase class C family)